MIAHMSVFHIYIKVCMGRGIYMLRKTEERAAWENMKDFLETTRGK